MTAALYIAIYCKCVPDEHWNHDPILHDHDGWTVAKGLIYNAIIPPK